MSARAPKLWLVAYDVACPRRLRRVHRRVARSALRLQLSLYAARAADRDVAALLDEVDGLIDAAEDDVRAYHVPRRCTVWTIGREALADGVSLDAEGAVRFLLGWEHGAEGKP